MHAHRLRSRRRGQAARRDLLPAHRTCPSTRCSRTVAATDGRRAAALLRAYVGRPDATAVTSPAARSSESTTASTCSPTTARSATCSVTACSPSSGSRCQPRHGYDRPEAVDEAGCDEQFDAAMERSAELYDALVERSSREQAPYARVAGLPHPLRRCRSTPARRCTCSSCARDRRGTPPIDGSARRCTASSPRRPDTTPSPRPMRTSTTTESELERLDAERRAEARRLGH